MRKPYVSTIRSGPSNPFLGVFEGEVHTWDASTVGPEVEILRIGKGQRSYCTKYREALIGHKSIKCVKTNDLDAETVAVLETLPRLEQLQISHRRIPSSLNLAGLSSCRYVMLNDVRQLESIDIVANMPSLECLFVRGPKTLDLEALSTLNLRELAMWCFFPWTEMDPLFSNTKLEYLCLGGIKPAPEDCGRFRDLKHLEQIEFNSSSHPFDFYARMDSVLSQRVDRNWRLLVRLAEECSVHPGHPLLQASGSRQRPFCELCSPKRLEKLAVCYASLTGVPLPVPKVESEQFGMSKDGKHYRFFT